MLLVAVSGTVGEASLRRGYQAEIQGRASYAGGGGGDRREVTESTSEQCGQVLGWEEVWHVQETRERGPGLRPICLSRLDVCAASLAHLNDHPFLGAPALSPSRGLRASLPTPLCPLRAKMASTHLLDGGLSTEEVH